MAAAVSTRHIAGKAFILGFLLIVLIAFLIMIKSYLIALVLAGITAALLMSVQRWMIKKLRGRTRTAAAVVLILTILIIGIPLIGLAALVTNEAVKVGTTIAPWIAQQIGKTSSLEDLLSWIPFSEQLEPYWENILQQIGKIGSSIGSFIVSSIPNLTKGTISLTLNGFIYLYALYFFLVHGTNTVQKLEKYIPLDKEDSELILERGITVIRASLKGILIIGFIQGLLMSIAFWVIGIQGAAFWGAIVVVLSAIPGVGAPLVWVPAAVYLVSAGEIGWAIGLSVWGALVVGLVDNILRPAVVGRDAKLPDLLILVSILGGLSLFGASGILIGPVLAALVVTAMDIYKTLFSSELESSGEAVSPEKSESSEDSGGVEKTASPEDPGSEPEENPKEQ
jgi:predicted PurR-regulated permease PerM